MILSHIHPWRHISIVVIRQYSSKCSQWKIIINLKNQYIATIGHSGPVHYYYHPTIPAGRRTPASAWTGRTFLWQVPRASTQSQRCTRVQSVAILPWLSRTQSSCPALVPSGWGQTYKQDQIHFTISPDVGGGELPNERRQEVGELLVDVGVYSGNQHFYLRNSADQVHLILLCYLMDQFIS